MFQQNPVVGRAIMRSGINGFCVLAAVASSCLHERHGAEALRASRRGRRLGSTFAIFPQRKWSNPSEIAVAGRVLAHPVFYYMSVQKIHAILKGQ